MSRLDGGLNNAASWKEILRLNTRQVEVDLNEVERVIELARRTPGLSEHEQSLRQLSVFFQGATEYYREKDPDGLVNLVRYWERYRAAVIQRYIAITPVELRAADRVVKNIFDRFLNEVPNDRIAYSPDAYPLVYGGEGGLGAYFTHPPSLNRPFAIINLPHTAFDNVWQWLALPHETGHDLYATVKGLDQDLENALAERMREAVTNGEVNIPSVNLDLNPFEIPHVINYAPEDFLPTVWRRWTNESQADVIGILNCGGAASVALQQIIGFSATDGWELIQNPNGTFQDGPEVHPTSYVRNTLNIAALRAIGGHDALANEIEQRFHRLRPTDNDITWLLGGTLEVARVPVAEMEKSARIAARVLVHHQLVALGNKSFAEVATFDAEDQNIVDTIVPLLARGDPTFASQTYVQPRHALAATIFAFEDDRSKVDLINRTFRHFV